MSEEKIKKYLSAMRVIDYNKEGFLCGKEVITEALDLIEKQDKIIDEMAKTILEDTIKLDTFWCNGCTKVSRCPYNSIEECIKEYFEKKASELV